MAEKHADKRFITSNDGQSSVHSTFSLTPDIIFMIQRAGLTVSESIHVVSHSIFASSIKNFFK